MSKLAEKYTERIHSLSPINSLPPAHQAQLLEQSHILEVRRREFVFHQGDKDDYAFYVLDGCVEMFADDTLIKQVEGGTAAAVNALAQLQPRQLSARARTAAVIFRANRGLLDRLLSVEAEPPTVEVSETVGDAAEEDDWLGRLLQSELFNRVPPSNIQQLLNSLEPFEAGAGEFIVRQGDPGDFYYVIQSGRAEVVRTGTAPGSFVRLAELGPGDGFGEEALVSDSRRNASIRMLTDGGLVRLTKEDFVNLIKKPVLHGVSAERAAEMVAAGAAYLDVRQPSEYEENGFASAVNLPLNRLRSAAGKLDPDKAWICYCDTGGRSSTAAFLLTERGLEAYFVHGGCVDSSREPARPAPKPKPPEPPAAPPAEPRAADAADAAPAADTDIDADVRASTLTAQLAKANLDLEEARRIKAEAERARADTARIVEERLASERARLEAQSRRAAEMLREAERLRGQLEEEKRAAEAEVERRRQAETEKIERMKREAEAKLRAERERLEQVYQRNTAELEKLQRQRAEAEARIKAEREAMRSDAAATKRRLAEAMEREKALEEEARRLATEQEARERELLEATQSTLTTERRKLEAEFARTQSELQHAREERRAAEAARKAAAAEAETIIEEFKREHEALRKTEMEKLEKERQRLAAESERIATAVKQARKVQRDAEQARAEALLQQRELQARQAAAGADEKRREAEAQMAARVALVEQRAAAAARQLEVAERAQNEVQAQSARTESELVRTYEGSGELDPALASELEEWLAEQARQQETTMEREKLRQKAEITARINAQARRAHDESANHNQSLLDELAAQLGGDDD